MIINRKCYFCTDGKINDRSKKTGKRIKKLITCPVCNGNLFYDEEIDDDKIAKMRAELKLLKSKPKDTRIDVGIWPLVIYFGRIHNTEKIEPIKLLCKAQFGYVFAIIKSDSGYTLVHIPSTIKTFENVNKKFLLDFCNSLIYDEVNESYFDKKVNEFYGSQVYNRMKEHKDEFYENRKTITN